MFEQEGADLYPRGDLDFWISGKRHLCPPGEAPAPGPRNTAQLPSVRSAHCWRWADAAWGQRGLRQIHPPPTSVGVPSSVHAVPKPKYSLLKQIKVPRTEPLEKTFPKARNQTSFPWVGETDDVMGLRTPSLPPSLPSTSCHCSSQNGASALCRYWSVKPSAIRIHKTPCTRAHRWAEPCPCCDSCPAAKGPFICPGNLCGTGKRAKLGSSSEAALI